MTELKAIQRFLNRSFGDMPLHRLDDDGFSLADWMPRMNGEETDEYYLSEPEFPEIGKEAATVPAGLSSVHS
jgi:hypothetical protein